MWINEELLSPEPSQKVVNHSTDGFNWGYGGSGPSQMALAICLLLYPKQRALHEYQDFKREVISNLPIDQDFEIEIDETKLS